MFDPDTDARRMLVRERHDMLALDALRPQPGQAAETRGTSRGRRRRRYLRWPALNLSARAAVLDGGPRTISAAQGEAQRREP